MSNLTLRKLQKLKGVVNTYFQIFLEKVMTNAKPYQKIHNKVILLGRISTPSELRKTSKSQVRNMSICWDEVRRGEDEPRAHWFDLEIWGNSAGKDFKKRDLLRIEGRVLTKTIKKRDGTETRSQSFERFKQRLSQIIAIITEDKQAINWPATFLPLVNIPLTSTI
jgi:hypothetical protein